MILTIGMIMKNEERFLRDCLTAIKPILDNVDSELIIHDTGSTDNSIAIAKEFTDNVFEIEWRDDFGWARQQGFERAKGEWFFVLACDEIFEDVQEIIDFFNSGEYKNYGNAAVKIKNVTYGKIEPTYLSKPNSMRLYKIVEGMKWKGKIHEQLLPYAEPTKMLNSVFLHYGYLNEVVVEKNKSDKYLSMMLKAHEENLLDYQVIYFLAQSHQRLPKVALQYAQKALKLSKQTELDENYPHSLTIYPQSVRLVAHMCTKLGEHQKAIECIQEYFDTVPKQKITDIAYVLKIEQSILYEQESNFVESNKAALLAYEYKKLSDNNQLPVALGIAVDQIEEYVFITQILKTFILANLFIDAIEWLQNLLTVEDCKVDKYECYSNFFDLIAVHNPILLGDLHLYFVNKYNPSDKEYNDITALILMKSDSSNQATKTNLANIILQKNNNESQFVMFQRIQLNIDKLNTQNYDIDNCLAYFAQQTEISIIYADVLVIAIQYGKYFTEIYQKLNTQIFVLDKKINPIRFLYKIVNTLKNKLEETQSQPIFELFVDISHRYCKMLYSTNTYNEENIDLLPNEHIAIFYLAKAYKNKKEDINFTEYLQIAEKYAPLYQHYIQQIDNSQIEVEQNPQAQLKQEIDRLKSMIYEILNTGNVTQAQQIFETYAQINPADSDIPTMRKMLFN